ncbi:hypothetical protein CG709_07525 [Lachnotalea glycerini]|nr:hypothetical protein CG709_07525 [Lachnotalea glycerini]
MTETEVKESEYAAEDRDLVFTAVGNQDFETLENEAVKEAISKAEIVENIKELFGETMGCSIHVNIMVAALCIKNNLIPEQLLPVKERKINNIIVNGYDNLGNYVSFLISRS